MPKPATSCVGVLVLRYTDRERVRPFRVRALPLVAIAGALACLYTMKGLPVHAWQRFGVWLALGLVLYFAYGYRHSLLRRGLSPGAVTPPPGKS